MNSLYKKINKVLIDIAEYNYNTFKIKEHAAEGHNGPYGHSDTPVRNTAHWCIILGYLWKQTHNEKYYNLMLTFADYLCKIQKKSKSGAIECMTTDLFDHLNGLIGQAWVIEALIYVTKSSNIDKYYNTAVAIYKSQEYDPEKHLWKRIELGGENIGYDYTFNHQLYFAASASMISDYRYNEKIEKTVQDFLSGSMIHFNIHNDGLICHYVNLPRKNEKKYLLRKFIKTIGQPLKFIDPNAFNLQNHEIGYHLFDMYIFSFLYKKYRTHELFNTYKFKKAVKYALDITSLNQKFNIENFEKYSKTILKNIVKMNKFSYGYNSPAFELPVISNSFGRNMSEENLETLWDFQIKWFYDYATKSFSKNNFDNITLTARIYEIIPYLELCMEKEK